MKGTRKFGVLVLVLFLTAALCSPAKAFTKEPASWAAAQCSHLENDGLLYWGLYPDSYAPTDPISRGDFCQMLVNLVQMEGGWYETGVVQPAPDGYFADISTVDNGYGMYYAAAYGITEGATQNGQRVADRHSRLTREQAAKMIYAVTGALSDYGGVPAPAQGAAKSFTDQHAISSWAADPVSKTAAMGIFQGDSNGRFNPKGTLTWQEACVIVERLYAAAETSVTAQQEAQGIHRWSTAFDMNASKYLSQSASELYVLEHNGQRSVLNLKANVGDAYGVQVETYSASGVSTGVKTIPMELKTCGAFFEGAENYYLAFGQDNMEEDPNKPVIRIVKYDKNWNRLGAADLADCYISQPFRSTSHTAMAEENGTLLFHTACLRYYTPDDGLRHQSNFTAKIRTLDMTVLSKSAPFPSNHVSHSFAQYAAFDNGSPVYIDQGDAYPRGFTLSVEDGQGCVQKKNFFPFYGAIGDNTTNATGGGMGVSADNYLFMGASSPQKGNDNLKYANAFLSILPKDGSDGRTIWLTSFPADGKAFVNDTRLVQVNNNTFVAMWQVSYPNRHFHRYGRMQYAIFDGQGRQTGQTTELPGYILPNTDPSVYGTHILWATPELDTSDTYNTRKNRYLQIFALDIDANAETNATVQPVTMTLPEALALAPGKTSTLTPKFTGVQGTPTVTYTSSDPAVATVYANGLVSAVSPGTADITASMTWLGRTYTAKCTVTVAGAAVRIQVDETMELAVGETKSLLPRISGASGTVLYTSSDPSVVAANGSRITGVAPGTAVVTVMLTTQGQTYRATCTVTVTGENQTDGPGSTGNPGSSDIPGRTDKTEYVDGVTCTALPADGIVTYYREDYYGTWIAVEVVGGDTVRFTGMMPDDFGGRYNYAVVRAFGSQAETPFTGGVPFSVDVRVDAAGLAALYASQENARSILTAMIVQNHRPGQTTLAGYAFQSGRTVDVVPDGNGGIAFRVHS